MPQYETLALSRRDREVFFDVLTHPPAPAERLQRALAEHQRRVAVLPMDVIKRLAGRSTRFPLARLRERVAAGRERAAARPKQTPLALHTPSPPAPLPQAGEGSKTRAPWAACERCENLK
jgi:hypothetical protein